MSFVGSMFGGGQGAGFQAQGANIAKPVDVNEAQKSMAVARGGMEAQQQFLNKMQAAGAQTPEQQAMLAQLMMQRAQGGGPSAAQTQLASATGQNVANQAALMAGQRGAGANVGLMARQAGMQGMNAQQQAAGQAATLRAQEQIAAQQQAAAQQAQMMGQQQTGLNALNQNYLNYSNMALNALNAQNQAAVGMQSNINQANAGIAGANTQAQAGLLGGLMGGAGAAMGMAHGGSVPHMAEGGAVDNGGHKSFTSKFLNGMLATPGQNPITMGMTQFGQGLGNVIGRAFRPGLVGGNVGQAGSSDLPQSFAQTAYNGGAIDYTNGGKLPGKAGVKGDSLKNDKVPILGSPGEIMLPRSVTQHPDAPQKAAEFVAAILAKNKLGRK